MPRGSFGRSVARAASSGGGRSYRSRPAVGWYLTLVVIVVAGVSLIVYSRQERLHPPVAAASASSGPTASSSWHVALAFDLCGVLQKPLPANTNLSVTGIRTFGDGLIYVEPGVVAASKQAEFEGKNATLATFVANYPKLVFNATTLKLPDSKSYSNGDYCTKLPAHPTVAQRHAALGLLRVETWASPTAKGKILSTTLPGDIHLTNGMMISIGFVTPSEKLPVPPSEAELITLLGGTTNYASKK